MKMWSTTSERPFQIVIGKALKSLTSSVGENAENLMFYPQLMQLQIWTMALGRSLEVYSTVKDGHTCNFTPSFILQQNSYTREPGCGCSSPQCLQGLATAEKLASLVSDTECRPQRTLCPHSTMLIRQFPSEGGMWLEQRLETTQRNSTCQLLCDSWEMKDKWYWNLSLCLILALLVTYQENLSAFLLDDQAQSGQIRQEGGTWKQMMGVEAV